MYFFLWGGGGGEMSLPSYLHVDESPKKVFLIIVYVNTKYVLVKYC